MKTLPFYGLLIMTFGLAALDKILGGKVPTWFLDQFKGTVLDLFPGNLEISFIAITLLELATAIVLIIGLAKREFLSRLANENDNDKRFLQIGIVLAQVTFIALGFGQRLTHKFDSAGSLFFYAALTFIAGHIALKADA